MKKSICCQSQLKTNKFMTEMTQKANDQKITVCIIDDDNDHDSVLIDFSPTSKKSMKVYTRQITQYSHYNSLNSNKNNRFKSQSNNQSNSRAPK